MAEHITAIAGGSGNSTVGERSELPVSHWQLNDRTIDLTASDGTTVNISLWGHNGNNFTAETMLDGVSAGKKNCVLTR